MHFHEIEKGHEAWDYIDMFHDAIIRMNKTSAYSHHDDAAYCQVYLEEFQFSEWYSRFSSVHFILSAPMPLHF